ncbi:ACT domain-containing protein [Novosphingobium album (ex Hu et al. 2023)]|uniref:ACT domain-containing protein n=1 Tax=Novosphingobium album (ex Hu et al. 2023) TaxID=2930093 RepID=A0ABT0B1J5_9SPHN|nr:ACT domain-containing protein [Novosphingobium album (ex Hu et al. 2023)]MCJ2178895.1 ACT domain-containing protein [Novosphingobium album (ex Hu et al. 2023)]
MNPRLDPQPWVFCTGGPWHQDALATFHEDEGLSQILPLDAAREAAHDLSLPMARIVLEVHSALDGTGLTAAVSGALAEVGIPCNMVAAYHHDHVFVPEGDAPRALAILMRLQSGA